MFTLATGFFLLCALFYGVGLLPLLLYAFLVFADSTNKNRSLRIGFLSAIAAYIQLIGYGSGFLYAWWQRCVLGKDEFTAFNKSFYK